MRFEIRFEMRYELDENQIKLKKECLENRTEQINQKGISQTIDHEPDIRLTDPLDELLGFGEVVHELKEINIF